MMYDILLYIIFRSRSRNLFNLDQLISASPDPKANTQFSCLGVNQVCPISQNRSNVVYFSWHLRCFGASAWISPSHPSSMQYACQKPWRAVRCERSTHETWYSNIKQVCRCVQVQCKLITAIYAFTIIKDCAL